MAVNGNMDYTRQERVEDPTDHRKAHAYGFWGLTRYSTGTL